MDTRLLGKKALSKLSALSTNKGYITYDDILKITDTLTLPLEELDRLVESLQSFGILVFETEPSSNEDDFIDYAQKDYSIDFYEAVKMEPSLKPLVDEIKNIPPPQWKEFSSLIMQAQAGNKFARTRIVSMNLRRTLSIALSKAKTYQIDLADTLSCGFIGLLLAIDKYDVANGGPFASYAAMWIQQSINRFAPTRQPLIYYPMHIKEKLFSIYPIYDNFEIQVECVSNDTPELIDLIADKIGSYEEAQKILGYMTPFESLTDDSLGLIDEDCEERLIEYINAKELQERIDGILTTLTDREEKIIRKRMGLAPYCSIQTLEEIGRDYGLTRERIRQIEVKALRKLRHPSRTRAILRRL